MGRGFDSHSITANSIVHSKKNHGEGGSKITDNSIIINDKALMHRFYGAVVVDGIPYRVMTLMREDRRFNEGNAVHAYEVQIIEVLNEETPSTPNGSHTSKVNALVPVAVAKVIKILKSHTIVAKNTC